jgi:hypothetical protein
LELAADPEENQGAEQISGDAAGAAESTPDA